MSGVRVYVEGGGDKRAGKDALRRGFGRLLEPLSRAARSKRLRWKVVACGSRNDAFADFTRAAVAYPDEFVVLLVDSEGPVATPPHEHLQDRDAWALDATQAENAHLMVQLMESWIVADPDALVAYYGPGFRPSVLPGNANVEAIPKAHVMSALHSSTKDCRKGPYCKRHGFELIGIVAEPRVRAAAHHCDRLFSVVSDWIVRSPVAL